MFRKASRIRWGALTMLVLGLAGVYSADVAMGKDASRAEQQRAEAAMDTKIAKARTAYKGARERCESQQGDARKACERKARTDRDAAIRQAKIEKVRELSALKEKEEERSKGQAKPVSTEARYAAAKARCEMMGFERDRCMAEAKQRFHKT